MGETFAVEGFYDASSGSGMWSVTDANTTWTCNASDGVGSCVSEAGDTIDWP